MIRTVIAVAAALLVGLGASAASAAESCPLCQAWPEVFGGNIKAAQQAEKARRAAQRMHAKTQKRDSEPKKIDTAKVETGTIADTSATTETQTAEKAAPAEKAEPQRDVGCMNFFPTVGKSLRVPCE